MGRFGRRRMEGSPMLSTEGCLAPQHGFELATLWLNSIGASLLTRAFAWLASYDILFAGDLCDVAPSPSRGWWYSEVSQFHGWGRARPNPPIPLWNAASRKPSAPSSRAIASDAMAAGRQPPSSTSGLTPHWRRLSGSS